MYYMGNQRGMLLQTFSNMGRGLGVPTASSSLSQFNVTVVYPSGWGKVDLSADGQ
jgi:hypothetical protein